MYLSSGAQQIPSPTTPGTITLIEGTAFCSLPGRRGEQG